MNILFPKKFIDKNRCSNENKIAPISYSSLIQRDGVLKLKKSPITNIRGVHQNLSPDHCTSHYRNVKDKIEKNQLINDFVNNQRNTQIAVNEAMIWLSPVSANKMAVQWHVPMGMQRSCLDILNNNNTCFVLRIYQNYSTQTGWKTSQRTLEFTIDISRRCCYVNLESNSGVYTAELGLRCESDRYIFISRSTPVKLLTIGKQTVKPSLSVVEKTMDSDWQKNPFLNKNTIITTLTPDQETGWESRDIAAEEQTRVIYSDFINEGCRVLRQKSKICPTPIISLKNVLNNRREKTTAKINTVSKKSCPRLVNVLNKNCDISLYTDKQYQLVAVNNKKEKIESDSKKYSDSHRNNAVDRPLNIKSQKLNDAINRLRDKAEIILRGKVKKKGQRVRVGGLLIEPEVDGTFCVACVIRNGRLYVPVDDVAAVCVKK